MVLGLFMLLSKRQSSEAETEWLGKAKVKGPVGLIVFCVGAALFVIIARQIPPSPSAQGTTRPSPSRTTSTLVTPGNDSTSAMPAPGGPHVEFTSPNNDSEIVAGQDVELSGAVAGLGDDTLWIVSQNGADGSYYPIDSVTQDGTWNIRDPSVGDTSDKGHDIFFLAVQANSDCAHTLSTRKYFDTLPGGCHLLPDQVIVRVK